MPIWGEIDENGVLMNICANRPETRNTTNTIVEVIDHPEFEKIHPEGIWEPVPLAYDADTKSAILHEELYNAEKEQDRKDEIVSLIRRKRDMQDAQEAYGIDYSTDLAEVEARLTELTS